MDGTDRGVRKPSKPRKRTRVNPTDMSAAAGGGGTAGRAPCGDRDLWWQGAGCRVQGARVPMLDEADYARYTKQNILRLVLLASSTIVIREYGLLVLFIYFILAS